MIRTYSVPAEAFVSQGTIIEPLEATENGTYNPPAGTAYSPVVVNVSGGSTTYTTIFDGEVTTEGSGAALGNIPNFSGTTADTIKVTFNGTEYICEYNGAGYGATGQDWSEYPFKVTINPIYGEWQLVTPTAGTYTLKIEEPQSSGGDFSTATVTYSLLDNCNANISRIRIYNNEINSENTSIWNGDTDLYVLYKGSQVINFSDPKNIETAPTNVEILSKEQEGNDYFYELKITGDCTLELEGYGML